MNSESKTIALLATARIANVPSVVSNLGVGVILGWAGSGDDFAWPWLLMLAAILFYVCGNFLNDWADYGWDRENRPERALPSGMFPRASYLAVALGGFGLGLGLAAMHRMGALIVSACLVVLICVYTKIHKSTAWGVVPMGLCRACLPVLGYVAISGEHVAPALFPAAGLFVYIVALSLSARWESKAEVPEGKKLLSRLLLLGAGVIPALPFLLLPIASWAGMIVFFIWMGLCVTRYRSPVPVDVSALLAGIPLVDGVTLLPVALVWMHLHNDLYSADPFHPMFSCAVFLPPAAFIMGRMLQRLAPAT